MKSHSKSLAFVLVTVVGLGLAASGCYVSAEPAYAGAPTVATSYYQPLYYNGYVVYYDTYGRPMYYVNGMAYYIPASYAYYGYYVNHYRRYRPYYNRWYRYRGYRYRRYRSARRYRGHPAYRRGARHRTRVHRRSVRRSRRAYY